MLQSIALMLLLGMALGWLCKKVRLPGLVGMIATGMILGPYGLAGWIHLFLIFHHSCVGLH